MPVFVGAGTSSFMKETGGVGMSTATTSIRNSLSGVRPGQMIFNHSTSLMEYYNGTAWIAIDTPPTVTSVNTTNILASQIDSGFDLVITGTFFSTGATVTFIGNNGSEHISPTTTVNSTTQITARVHSSVSNANEPYDVKVTNGSGLSGILEDAFNVNAKPVWSTTSGTIATILDTATGNHVTVSATDPEGDTVTYSETGSVLSNAGLSINSTTGVISGDANNVGDSSTTLSFTLRATSSGSNTTDRNFNIVVNPGTDGASAVRAATSAKAIYDAGFVTSGKAIKYINFGGSVGTKQVWCDFDTQDASGNSGWMLCAKFTEASQWGGRDNDIRTTNAYVDPGDGYAISCNMADADMNMMRITVEDSANQALGSSADADWYYEWTTTLPWKGVWQPEAGTGGGATGANGDKVYVSSSSGGNKRASIRKFQKSYNIKHSYTNSNHKFNNISDFGNNQSDTYVGSGSGVYGGDYHYITLGGSSETPAVGTFDMWYALSTNNQVFRIHYMARSGNYLNRTSPDTDGTLGILANGTTSSHTGQDQDGGNNVKIGYDDDQQWRHINTNPNDTGGSFANKNSNANGKNMYWWIK